MELSDGNRVTTDRVTTVARLDDPEARNAFLPGRRELMQRLRMYFFKEFEARVEA